MPFAKRLSHEYHDSALIRAKIGPRREIELTIRLDPVWNAGIERDVTLIISAIRNFDEVADFVRNIRPAPHPVADLDEIEALDWTPGGNGRVVLARYGAVDILRPKIAET